MSQEHQNDLLSQKKGSEAELSLAEFRAFFENFFGLAEAALDEFQHYPKEEYE